MKFKKLFNMAFVFQILITMGTISLFLTGLWGYDGSGGVKEQMYVRQFFREILAICSHPITIFIIAPLSLICLISAVIYIFRRMLKKTKHISWKTFTPFFLLTILNSAVYTAGYTFYLLIYFGVIMP